MVLKMPKIGRLAMRQEGAWWSAYYAMPESMVDAILLGSIALQLVQTQERKDAFMSLMRDAISDVIEQETGVRPTWEGPQQAPESERAGNG